MKVLLRSNADVNARCKDMLTPLYLAVHESQTEAAKLLMNYGADINLEFKTQETILSLAVSKGLSLIVKEVLKYSPDKNNASNKSVLAIAANKLENDYFEIAIVQDLMKYGFSVDQNDVVILIPRAIKASYIYILQHIFDHGLHLLCYEDANCNFLHKMLR
ncbi:GA-binding protein subunit beta-1-like [Eupeodes corollae]|uniref:GA-binding protein subunit beta-1-like n=1 Tax=Eupeodes corollae TaxID=290404 RepID=UPI0024915DE4|nr:GA-binding protein subunit beta-1-like [Eupeodes corollae]